MKLTIWLAVVVIGIDSQPQALTSSDAEKHTAQKHGGNRQCPEPHAPRPCVAEDRDQITLEIEEEQQERQHQKQSTYAGQAYATAGPLARPPRCCEKEDADRNEEPGARHHDRRKPM